MNSALQLAMLVPLLAPAAQEAHERHQAPPDPAVYSLAQGAQQVSLPLQLVANKLHIEAMIQGQGPFVLVLDTGMPFRGVLLYESERVAKLGLADSGVHVQVGGVGGERKPSDAIMADGLRLALGALTIEKGRAIVVARPEGFPLLADGVIGASLFENYVVRIDMDKQQLLLCEPAGWSPPKDVCSLPLELEGGKIFTELRIAIGAEEPVPARVVVDVGASHALALAAKPDGKFEPPAAALEMPLGRGLSGVLLGKQARVRRVELGGFAFENVVVGFEDGGRPHANGGGASAGNLGEELLRRFNVTFDYRGKRMLLEKSKSFANPFEIGMSGMAYDWQPDSTLRIRSVLPGSAAAAAELREGDIVTAIDGKPIAELGEAALYAALLVDGAELRLSLLRGAEKLEKKLRLKRLV
jgi:hypothetical protein